MQIYNLIRGLTRPYRGAQTICGNDRLVVWRSELPKDPIPSTVTGLRAGTVFGQTDGTLAVRTGDGYLQVVDYEIAGTPSLTVGSELGAG